MKKIMIISIVLIMLIVGILFFFVINYKGYQKREDEISKFNLEYEHYNIDNLNGLDITTLINRAISNNEKYAIPKDEEGLYVLDDKYSIEIYVTMIIDNTTYRMERLNKADMNAFTRYFGEVNFKCTDIQYHKKTGRVSSMTFEATEY